MQDERKGRRMKEKLLGIKRTLDTSIFVGERYERNMTNIAVTSGIVTMIGFVMTALNVIQGKYSIAVYPLFFFISGIISFILTVKFKNREAVVLLS